MPLDIGVGILGAVITAHIIGRAVTMNLVLFAVVCSLLPDIDFFIYFLRKKHLDEFAHEHRDLLHNPIPYIIIGSSIISAWSIPLSYLFAVLSFAHFLHDSVPAGGGWGIKWLFPFSKKYYRFFPYASWTFAEQRALAKKLGDPNWANHYLQSPELVVEILVFLLGVIALIIWR